MQPLLGQHFYPDLDHHVQHIHVNIRINPEALQEEVQQHNKKWQTTWSWHEFLKEGLYKPIEPPINHSVHFPVLIKAISCQCYGQYILFYFLCLAGTCLVKLSQHIWKRNENIQIWPRQRDIRWFIIRLELVNIFSGKYIQKKNFD